MSNTFGQKFRITTFGESHGKSIGVVVDGCPAGLALQVEDIQKELDRRKPGQTPVDLNVISHGVREAYHNKIEKNGLHPLKIFMENGRCITGPHGWLVSTVIHTKHIYKDYLGLDACMVNLMRPALYGAYHHITVLGKDNFPLKRVYDVVGSLCENNDKFAIDRMLPKTEGRDIVVIHTTGAHGYAMGSNYNGKLRSAELLREQDKGNIKQIRRAETIDDYFATLDFPEI